MLGFRVILLCMRQVQRHTPASFTKREIHAHDVLWVSPALYKETTHSYSKLRLYH